MTRTGLELELSDYDFDTRTAALMALGSEGVISGSDAEKAAPNMHMHSFFSYCGEGYSPTRLVYEARKNNMLAAGLVDFDVLYGLNEFISAGEVLGVSVAVSMESRVYVEDMCDLEINSPGEPGIAYHMGAGFYRLPEAGTKGAEGLLRMRNLAQERNRKVVEKLNGYLGELQLSYENDVITTTPSNNATERHIVLAMRLKAAELNLDAAYWAEKLGKPEDEITSSMKNPIAFENLLRASLIKQGGVAYITPERGDYPTLSEMNELTIALGGIPCATWLGGMTEGERDADRLVAFHKERGAEALNIIPYRSWNIADDKRRAESVACLHDIVRAVTDAGMFVVSGTEMNSPGLPIVDDLSNEYLAPIAEDIRFGARVLAGHTKLARQANRPLTGEWARGEFGGDRQARNTYYCNVNG